MFPRHLPKNHFDVVVIDECAQVSFNLIDFKI